MALHFTRHGCFKKRMNRIILPGSGIFWQGLLIVLLFHTTAISGSGDPAKAVHRSPLGTNLTRIDDYSTEYAFLDAFKTSRAWISGNQTDWDDRRSLYMDEHGWVRSLKPGQIARTLMFWGLSHAPGGYPSGRYVVTYEGEGTIEYTDNIAKVEIAPGREVLRVDSTNGGIGLFITSVNPSNYIRNIKVRMPIDAANRDPRMGNIYSRWLQDWNHATGGQLLMHSYNCNAYSQHGRFGSLEYLHQPRKQAPKYDALQRWIEGRPSFGCGAP